MLQKDGTQIAKIKSDVLHPDAQAFAIDCLATSVYRAHKEQRQRLIDEYDAAREQWRMAYSEKCSSAREDAYRGKLLAGLLTTTVSTHVLDKHSHYIWKAIEMEHASIDSPDKFNSRLWEESFGLLRDKSFRNCTDGGIRAWHYVTNISHFADVIFDRNFKKLSSKIKKEMNGILLNDLDNMYSELKRWTSKFTCSADRISAPPTLGDAAVSRQRWQKVRRSLAELNLTGRARSNASRTISYRFSDSDLEKAGVTSIDDSCTFHASFEEELLSERVRQKFTNLEEFEARAYPKKQKTILAKRAIGSTEVCPYCGCKTILPEGATGPHRCQNHMIQAFHGTRTVKYHKDHGKTVISPTLRHCHEAEKFHYCTDSNCTESLAFLKHWQRYHGQGQNPHWEEPMMTSSYDEYDLRQMDYEAQRAAWVAIGPALAQRYGYEHLPVDTIVPQDYKTVHGDCAEISLDKLLTPLEAFLSV